MSALGGSEGGAGHWEWCLLRPLSPPFSACGGLSGLSAEKPGDGVRDSTSADLGGLSRNYDRHLDGQEPSGVSAEQAELAGQEPEADWSEGEADEEGSWI